MISSKSTYFTRQEFHLLPFPLIIPAGVSFKVNYLKDDYSLTNIENVTLAGFVIEPY